MREQAYALLNKQATVDVEYLFAHVQHHLSRKIAITGRRIFRNVHLCIPTQQCGPVRLRCNCVDQLDASPARRRCRGRPVLAFFSCCVGRRAAACASAHLTHPNPYARLPPRRNRRPPGRCACLPLPPPRACGAAASAGSVCFGTASRSVVNKAVLARPQVALFPVVFHRFCALFPPLPKPWINSGSFLSRPGSLCVRSAPLGLLRNPSPPCKAPRSSPPTLWAAWRLALARLWRAPSRARVQRAPRASLRASPGGCWSVLPPRWPALGRASTSLGRASSTNCGESGQTKRTASTRLARGSCSRRTPARMRRSGRRCMRGYWPTERR